MTFGCIGGRTSQKSVSRGAVTPVAEPAYESDRSPVSSQLSVRERPMVDAARHHDPVAQPGVRREVEAVVDLGLLAEMGRLTDHVVVDAELRGADVVEAAQLVAPAARQARSPWGR